ncbi:MAG: hypothetical protein CMN30_19220 [Sandaracinus sp.]|nr:hypothetical protein [Sandaracinus sp.]|tara:strand:- start:2968 stop:3708 length:741 start_codon:yes stop_codon:yes gene_type:complete
MTHLRDSLAAPALLGGFLFALGCTGAAPDGPLEPGPRMQVRHGCLRNRCEARLAAESRQCSDCTSACFAAGWSCNVSDACEYSCEASRPCSELEQEECIEEGFEVALPNDPSDDLEAACLRAYDHLATCFGDSPPPASTCELYALTERPELATAYDCYATSTCDQLASGESAACDPPLSDLGDVVCGRLDDLCGGSCDDETRQWLNEQGAWWRSDVRAVGLTCSGQATCDDAFDCIEVWLDAVVAD